MADDCLDRREGTLSAQEPVMMHVEGLLQMFIPGKGYFCLFGRGYAQNFQAAWLLIDPPGVSGDT